ncbi:hypothetical protein IQ289_02460 [Burkholderia sp. R-70006]|uniref:hypothetical protein n=1 Tax=Paraburkholderia domus TaxID=2793075 RepID=UPI00191331FC|nr:hypothetical protein [Paraburkholderia domus]MBK5047258.1 hypothetical protein [Burkholderia sp. R-70006]
MSQTSLWIVRVALSVISGLAFAISSDWVAAATCIANVSYPSDMRPPTFEDPGQVFWQAQTGRYILVLLDSQLLELEPGESALRHVPGAQNLGSVEHIHPLGDGKVLVGTSAGVYILSLLSGRSRQLATAASVGSVKAAEKLSDGRILVGTTLGIFQLVGEGDSLVRFEKGAKVEDVSEIHPTTGGAAFVTASNGLFRVSSPSQAIERLEAVSSPEDISIFESLGHGWFHLQIGYEQFALAPGTHHALSLGTSTQGLGFEWNATSDRYAYFFIDGALTQTSIDSNDVIPISVAEPLGELESMVSLSNGTLMLSTEHGLFSVLPSAHRAVRVAPVNETGEYPSIGTTADGRLLILRTDGVQHMTLPPDSEVLPQNETTLKTTQPKNPSVNQPSRNASNAPTVAVGELTDSKIGLLDAETGRIAVTDKPAPMNAIGREFSDISLPDGRTFFVEDNDLLVLSPHAGNLNKIFLLKNKEIHLNSIQLQNGSYIVFAGNHALVISSGVPGIKELNHDQFADTVNLTRAYELSDSSVLLISDAAVFRFVPGLSQLQTVGDRFIGTRLLADSNRVSQDPTPMVLINGQVAAVVVDDLHKAKVTFEPSSGYAVDTPVTLAASVKGGPCEGLIGMWHPKIRIWQSGTKESDGAVVSSRETTGALLTFPFKFQKAGAYHFRLESSGGDRYIGAPGELQAGTALDTVKVWTERAGLAVVIINILAVVGLAFGARRFDTCFRLLFDPVWGKVAFYFNSVLRHSRFLQIWLLDRYFRNAKEKLSGAPDEPYDPLPLTTSSKEVRQADVDLLMPRADRRHVWLQGSPGMGKSALVRTMERAYFAAVAGESSSNAFTAWRRWQAVFLFIPARRFESVGVDTNAPEAWLPKVVSQHLAYYGLGFPDVSTIQAMLDAGTLAVVIDGINEVGRDEQIAAFALRSPLTTVFVTSQTEGREPFFSYRLPLDIRAYVGNLLRAYMGEDNGRRLEDYLHNALPELVGSLRSGYDVRLVLDLMRLHFLRKQTASDLNWAGSTIDSLAESLPSTRTALYDAILAGAGANYPIDDLAKIAWKMWLEERRELVLDASMKERLLRPLERHDVNIVRRLSTEALEFRHDQMRAFLAARWLVRQATNLETLLLHLDAPEVWKVATQDQEELWRFLSALLPADLIPLVWQFSVAKKERGNLQHALQAEASIRAIQLFARAIGDKVVTAVVELKHSGRKRRGRGQTDE